MKFYLAPMEEITSFIYRNTLSEFFGTPDRCFAPFIAPTEKRIIKKREAADIDPSNNHAVTLIPQILTRHSKGFLDVTKLLYDLGYREVNFNLGCPSGTVTAKGKGSGFLKTLDALDRFFTDIFAETEQLYHDTFKISVKSRIGFDSVNEFPDIFRILRSYPFSEIVIHPRLRTDFYKGKCRMDAWEYAYDNADPHSLIYNGDISSVHDIRRIRECYPDTEGIMIGRGLIRNPGLLREVKTGAKLTKDELYDFSNTLFRRYADFYSDETNAMYKHKELWTYFQENFVDAQRPMRNLLKAKKPDIYKQAHQKIFECDFLESLPDSMSPIM